jgi:hypothetical protein
VPHIARKQITPEDLDRYENLLKEAFKTPWWVEYIKLTQQRLNDYLTKLVDGHLDTREEDKLRGKIDECSFPLSLDDAAGRLNDPELQEKLKDLRMRRVKNG